MNPSMSVLDRVKMFLPQIEKANADLEKEITIHGNDRFLIDKDLVNQMKEAPLIVETSEESAASNGIKKDDQLEEEEDAEQSEGVIELAFALGDFSESAIALAEDQMIEAEKAEKEGEGADQEGESDTED